MTNLKRNDTGDQDLKVEDLDIVEA